MLLSLPLVYVLVRDQPSRKERPHPLITNVEHEQEPRLAIAYHRDPRFWLLVTGGSLNAFCAFGLLNWLPTYFNRAKGIDFEQLGWPLALVFTAGIVGMALMAF